MERIIKVGVLVTKKDKILLIKEWSELKKGYYWNIVKGTYDDTIDKKFSDCAIRESKEETGIIISLKGFIGMFMKYGYDVRIYLGFTASVTDGEPHIAPQKEQMKRNENIKEVKWLTKKELEKIKKEDFLNDIAYFMTQKWIKNEVYPLNLINEIVLDHKPI